MAEAGDHKRRMLPLMLGAIGVGSRSLTKRWPPEHFAALARQALERFGGAAIFIVAPDEMELARRAACLVPGARDVTGKTSLPQLAAIVHEADVVLANDTGPLHLAAALGRPVVAPYTCTKVRLNGPYDAERGAVETAVWCGGSYVKRCRRLECMTELTPDRLWPLVQALLPPSPESCRSA